MRKKALIIEPDEFDKKIIDDLDNFGYSALGLLIEDTLGISPLFKYPRLKESIIFCLTNKMITNYFIKFRYLMYSYSKIIRDKNISFIAPTHKINDINLLMLGFLNELFELPGLTKKQAKFWYRKSHYLKHFKSLGFKAPNTLQIVPMKEYPEQISTQFFPVICKPDYGSGGDGVYIAKSPEELNIFFQPAPEDEKSWELEKLHRQKDHLGRIRNYLFSYLPSNYLIQEYIFGSVISIAGIKAINGIEISLIYEIIPSKPPFQSESEFYAPFFGKKETLNEIHSIAEKIAEDTMFPYGPFMLDFILDLEGVLWLIDIGPRFSGTGIQFLEICYGDTSYIMRSISALLNKKINIQKRNEPLYAYSKRLPLPKGRLINCSLKESFSEYVVDWKFTLKPGDEIFRERNEFLSQRRGHITVIGKDIQEAKNRWSQEFKKLEISIQKYSHN